MLNICPHVNVEAKVGVHTFYMPGYPIKYISKIHVLLYKRFNRNTQRWKASQICQNSTLNWMPN